MGRVFVGGGAWWIFLALVFARVISAAAIDSVDSIDRIGSIGSIDSHRRCVFTRTPKTKRPWRYGFRWTTSPTYSPDAEYFLHQAGRQAGGPGREVLRAGRGHTFSFGTSTVPVL